MPCQHSHSSGFSVRHVQALQRDVAQPACRPGFFPRQSARAQSSRVNRRRLGLGALQRTRFISILEPALFRARFGPGRMGPEPHSDAPALARRCTGTRAVAAGTALRVPRAREAEAAGCAKGCGVLLTTAATKAAPGDSAMS